MRKICIIFFLITTIFGFDLKDLTKTLKTDNIRGDFIQEKNFYGLEISIKSNGDFLIKKENEFIWNTIKPLQATIKINKDGVWQKNDENKWIKIKNNKADEIFFTMLKMDYDFLIKNFDNQLSGNKTSWTLKLIPKQTILKNIFTQISIHGNEYLKSFDINETQGDSTKIIFNNIKNF